MREGANPYKLHIGKYFCQNPIVFLTDPLPTLFLVTAPRFSDSPRRRPLPPSLGLSSSAPMKELLLGRTNIPRPMPPRLPESHRLPYHDNANAGPPRPRRRCAGGTGTPASAFLPRSPFAAGATRHILGGGGDDESQDHGNPGVHVLAALAIRGRGDAAPSSAVAAARGTGGSPRHGHWLRRTPPHASGGIR